MTNSQSRSDIAHAIPMQGSQDQLHGTAKIWMATFGLAIFALFVCEPTALISTNIAVSLMFGMVLVVQNATATFMDERAFEVKMQFIALLASAQVACLVWTSIVTGRVIFGDSLVVATLAAFVALVLAVVVEAAVSIGMLYAVERGKGSGGASIAALISSKYAGLFGRIA
ncbi:MAG: hypothetical protein ACRCU5_04285 [Rhizobiaceae bacterium]